MALLLGSIYEYPIKIMKGPGPVNYVELFADVSLVASLHEAANNVGDGEVRAALQSGIANAVRAMQKRAGDQVRINFGQQTAA